MWIITSIICFLFLFWLIRNLEERKWGSYTREWEPCKLAIWKWILMTLICILPLANITMTISTYIVILIEVNVGDLRFKGGKKTWFDKLLAFLCKKI